MDKLSASVTAASSKLARVDTDLSARLDTAASLAEKLGQGLAERIGELGG